MRGGPVVRAIGTVLLLGSIVAGGCSRSASTADPILDLPGVTVPPGQSLPTDADCADRVRPSGNEIRPANDIFNKSAFPGKTLTGVMLQRVTGDFTGTTDEILQWASCKWGIDVDVVRAQAAQESSWFMNSVGDFTDQPQWCAPGHTPGMDGKAGCPESVGIMGVKFRYHAEAFPEAAQSTAYNLDYALAVWRSCFEGLEGWLAEHPPNSSYQPGDLWGCVGRWYAGDWRGPAAAAYIGRVQAAMSARIWSTEWFSTLRAPASAG